ALAEELGLEVRKTEKYGWSETALTPALLERYAGELAELREAHAGESHARRVAPMRRRKEAERSGEGEGGEGGEGEGEGEGEGGEGGGEEPSASGRRVALVCQCERPRRIWIAAKGLEIAPITCGGCGVHFAPAT